MQFLRNISIPFNLNEALMTINQAQSEVYFTQMNAVSGTPIWKGVIDNSSSLSVVPLNISYSGFRRDLQLNNSDSQLVLLTTGFGSSSINVIVISTNGSLVGATTLRSINSTWNEAYGGTLILQKNLAIVTTARSESYPHAIFSANIDNLIGTVLNRDNPVAVLEATLFKVETFLFSPDNSQLFVVGYSTAFYEINILSFNSSTFSLNSRIIYPRPDNRQTVLTFISSAINATASTLSLFYSHFYTSSIANIVVSYAGGNLTLHPSTQTWVTPNLQTGIDLVANGVTDLANNRQIIVDGRPRGVVLSLRNIT